jgi:ABC-type amino acid transport substrate-binding protein
MNHRRAFFGVVLLILFILIPGIEIAGKNLPPKIKVILDDNYPPYVYRDNGGHLQGIVVDQWKLWEQRTGIPVEIEAMDWNLVLETAKAGSFDVIDTNGKNILALENPMQISKLPFFFIKTSRGSRK